MMTKKEAMEWMNGDRDMINLIPDDPIETWEVRVQRANAAKIQQAYWVLRSHQEGLIRPGTKEE